jgi:hypothetical protein
MHDTYEIVYFIPWFIWLITIFFIVRAVRQKDLEFVSNAITGNIWLGTGNMDMSWWVQLYKRYFKYYGINALMAINLLSFIVTIIIACYFLLKVIIPSLS